MSKLFKFNNFSTYILIIALAFIISFIIFYWLSKNNISINTTLYGGFEQVGFLGHSLPTKDENITTKPGDIMLYNGNNIVVFFGENTWSYTRLGKIQGLSKKELEELLGKPSTKIIISNDE